MTNQWIRLRDNDLSTYPPLGVTIETCIGTKEFWVHGGRDRQGVEWQGEPLFLSHPPVPLTDEYSLWWRRTDIE